MAQPQHKALHDLTSDLIPHAALTSSCFPCHPTAARTACLTPLAPRLLTWKETLLASLGKQGLKRIPQAPCPELFQLFLEPHHHP